MVTQSLCRKTTVEAMFDAPQFNVPIGKEISGDDPLGLAPVNERLYRSVFPGINNVVRYIRIYALLCWAARRVEEHAEQEKVTSGEALAEMFEAMREKIELVITWAHIGKVKGLVGTRRRYPDDNRPVALRFATFGASEAAYMSAPQYRPSLTNGLGFMEVRDFGIVACTSFGASLAGAMDGSLRRSPHYRMLSDVTRFNATRRQVLQLHSCIDLLRPSKEERAVFLSRLIADTQKAEDETLDANRRAGMLLTLRAVAALNHHHRRRRHIGALEADIRATMARGCTPDGKDFDLSAVERSQAKWAVLQLRQFQRACYEAYYVTLEYLLSRPINGPDASVRGVARLMGRLTEEALEGVSNPRVADLEQNIRTLRHPCTTLYRAGLTQPDADLFRCRAELLNANWEVEHGNGIELLAHATLGLVYCAVEAESLSQAHPITRSYLALDSDKKPLSTMPGFIAKYRQCCVSEFVEQVVVNDVIARHFDVVSLRSRTGDNKNRLRFVEGSTGLRRYDERRPLPGIVEAEDHLARALDLLTQCKLLAMDDGGFIATRLASRLYGIEALGR